MVVLPAPLGPRKPKTSPACGEPQAVYFNNGDLKFGRNMHCRVTATGTTACYVSNYGTVGEDDSITALPEARASGTPVATVTMEYDPTATNGENRSEEHTS